MREKGATHESLPRLVLERFWEPCGANQLGPPQRKLFPVKLVTLRDDEVLRRAVDLLETPRVLGKECGAAGSKKRGIYP
jgi:hypothetical protein